MGFFSQQQPESNDSNGSLGYQSIEKHAEALKTPDWLLASAKAYHGWAAGKELSQAEYQAALDVAANCSTGPLRDKDGNPTSGAL